MLLYPPMIHEILPVGLLQCNCSIFGDEKALEAIVVDPGDEVDEITKILERHRLRVKVIVVTHAHIDHIGGAAKLKKSTGAPVYMNEQDFVIRDQLDVQAGWIGVEPPEKPEIDMKLREGDSILLAEQSFDVLDTPGHTPGSISLHIPSQGKVIAGDTLFRESIGRTDLPGGDPHRILASIKEKLLTLDDQTIVIPGHGPETTIGRERELNYFLRGL